MSTTPKMINNDDNLSIYTIYNFYIYVYVCRRVKIQWGRVKLLVNFTFFNFVPFPKIKFSKVNSYTTGLKYENNQSVNWNFGSEIFFSLISHQFWKITRPFTNENSPHDNYITIKEMLLCIYIFDKMLLFLHFWLQIWSVFD